MEDDDQHQTPDDDMAGAAEPAATAAAAEPPTAGAGEGGSNGGSQHYSLRWNNHQAHVLSAFESMLQSEALLDCSLVCEDGGLKAHRVVLSACSPYFRKIFVENPCKHPVIVLKDIRSWEMQCIVDFMYRGETSVPEGQLTGLVRAAESLKVRGLTSADQQLPPGLAVETSECTGRDPKLSFLANLPTRQNCFPLEKRKLLEPSLRAVTSSTACDQA